MRETIGKLNVCVDERIELLSVVQYLSNYGEQYPFLVTIEENLYKKKVDEYFKHIKKDAVILKFEELSSDGFDFHVPIKFMLHLSENLNIRIPFDNEILERGSGIVELESFIRLLKSVSDSCDFNKFFMENQMFYNELVNKFISIIGNFDYMMYLKRKYLI